MGLSQRSQSVINTGIDIHHFTVPFNRINRRDEARALQAVTVQFIRWNIRCSHQRDLTREQSLHQRAKQHGICNVRDKKFIEA
ncbi:hypothetical protein D3C75_1087900 [compost metagenome]